MQKFFNLSRHAILRLTTKFCRHAICCQTSTKLQVCEHSLQADFMQRQISVWQSVRCVITQSSTVSCIVTFSSARFYDRVFQIHKSSLTSMSATVVQTGAQFQIREQKQKQQANHSCTCSVPVHVEYVAVIIWFWIWNASPEDLDTLKGRFKLKKKS